MRLIAWQHYLYPYYCFLQWNSHLNWSGEVICTDQAQFTRFLTLKRLNDGFITNTPLFTSSVDNCDVFISCLDLWRHPFTAVVSKWCNAKFLHIYSGEETNSSTFWMAWGRVHFSDLEWSVHLLIRHLPCISSILSHELEVFNAHCLMLQLGHRVIDTVLPCCDVILLPRWWRRKLISKKTSTIR